MASNIPSNFIDLFNASTRQNYEVNIIGVVTDALPSTKSRGRDWICTFSIADLTTGQYDDGLKIRFFKALESDLPKIQGTGDVIILRNIKMKEWSGMTIGISSYATSWTLFPASSIPVGTPSKPYIKHIKDPRAPVPSPAEMQYAMLLCNSRDRDSFCLVSKPASFSSNLPSTQISSSAQEASTLTRREKFSLIKDVQIDNFYDLVGQVVKIFPNNGCVEIYITDYTSNPLLYNYEWGCPGQNEGNGRDGDEFNYAPRNSSNKKWPGPFGRNTLTVTLWPSHSYFAQSNIQEKHFVFLRNVRIKYSKDNKVEGVMYTDKRYPDRIDVSILENHIDHDRVKEVLRRKRDYNERFKSQSEAYVNEVRGLDNKGERQKLSRAQKNKKKRKLQVEQSAKSKRLEQEKDRLHESNETVAVLVPKSTKSELNKNSTSSIRVYSSYLKDL